MAENDLSAEQDEIGMVEKIFNNACTVGKCKELHRERECRAVSGRTVNCEQVVFHSSSSSLKLPPRSTKRQKLWAISFIFSIKQTKSPLFTLGILTGNSLEKASADLL